MELFDKIPPKDADDFARNLLEGRYAAADSALVQKHLREQMVGVLKDGSLPKLKRVETRTYSGAAKPEEIAAVASGLRGAQRGPGGARERPGSQPRAAQ
eukprot:SRR837773.23929.p1 GENE.SRR837773.23929~~SRR837773.23929.p1  ORF type:complete len:111 (-),score=29.77 SRR837773.23929:62-358(-)